MLETRTLITGSLLLLAAVSGVMVSALGRPLNIAVSTAHKLLALSSVVLAVILVRTMQKAGGIDTLAVVMIVVMGVLFLSLFISGAFLSFDKPVSILLRAVHAALPFFALFTTLVLAYLRLRKNL